MYGFVDQGRHPRAAPRAIAPALAALALLACTEARALDCFATGNVQVRCIHIGGGAVRANYTVDLSQGSSGNFAQRTMRFGNSELLYNLFNSATYTQIWGNGTGGSVRVAYSLLVNPGNFQVNIMDHPIYGRIPAQQPVDTGLYSDTILVTLTF